jgi:hypothetical protein
MIIRRFMALTVVDYSRMMVEILESIRMSCISNHHVQSCASASLIAHS